MSPEELARAHGYPQHVVRLVGELVRKRRADARVLRIGARDLEIEMIEGASVVMQHPGNCPHYEPAPDSPRCRSYLPNGACTRPDELLCIELLKRRVGNGIPASLSNARD